MEETTEQLKQRLSEIESQNAERVGKMIDKILTEEGYGLISDPPIHINGQPLRIKLVKT